MKYIYIYFLHCFYRYETGTVIIRQGHVATECYLVLSGRLEFTMMDVRTRIHASDTLCEAEEGDFLGVTIFFFQ